MSCQLCEQQIWNFDFPNRTCDFSDKMTDNQTNDEQPRMAEDDAGDVVVSDSAVEKASPAASEKASLVAIVVRSIDDAKDETDCGTVSTATSDTDSLDDEEVFEQARIHTLREFFLRAFLHEKYPLPKEIYSYEVISSILEVKMSSNWAANFYIKTSNSQLVDYLVKFYRERKNPVKMDKPGGFFTTCLIEKGRVVFRATPRDVTDIKRFFFEPVVVASQDGRVVTRSQLAD